MSAKLVYMEFIKGIGLTSATTLVMGSMIGSGIFIVSADIARITASPALLILAWLVTGVMTIIAALSYGELAAMMPNAGGQYVYLRESLGRIWGFLYGWTLFLVIQTGTIAAVGVAFGKFCGVLVPWISSANWLVGPFNMGSTHVGLNTQNATGILLVILLTAINVRGVKTGAIVQNVFTITKVAALLGLVCLGLLWGQNHEAIAVNFGNFWRNTGSDGSFPALGLSGILGAVVVVAVAQVGSLFSADAWNNVTFTAGEVINPKRNLPLSLAIGVGVVIAIYIATNFVYLAVLPLESIQHAAEDRVGTAVMQVLFSDFGAILMAVLIMISTAGCNNGLILAGARVYYAMAKDGLFFRKAGELHPRYRTPQWSLWVQCFWACLLCLSGTYSQLLDYIIFAVLIFYVLTIAGLFVLRRTRPDAPRPYRAFGYPILPALYIVMALFIDSVLLVYKPEYTWPGLIIVLTGIPVYFVWSRQAK